MNMMQKILMIMGVAYIALGGTITVCFAVFGFPGPFLAIPLFFDIGNCICSRGTHQPGKKEKNCEAWS